MKKANTAQEIAEAWQYQRSDAGIIAAAYLELTEHIETERKAREEAEEDAANHFTSGMRYKTLAEAAESRLREVEAALCEIREVWAGSECGEPKYAQEAYAIRLCKQMYQIACDALAPDRTTAPG